MSLEFIEVADKYAIWNYRINAVRAYSIIKQSTDHDLEGRSYAVGT